MPGLLGLGMLEGGSGVATSGADDDSTDGGDSRPASSLVCKACTSVQSSFEWAECSVCQHCREHSQTECALCIQAAANEPPRKKQRKPPAAHECGCSDENAAASVATSSDGLTRKGKEQVDGAGDDAHSESCLRSIDGIRHMLDAEVLALVEANLRRHARSQRLITPTLPTDCEGPDARTDKTDARLVVSITEKIDKTLPPVLQALPR